MKGWQSGWFYITEPHDTNWAAAPEFRSGVPMRHTSWQERGLTWGPSTELTGLQMCVQNMIGRKIKLVNVVQVMFIRRVLPCQRRTCYLGSTTKKENHGFRNPCLFLPNHPRKRMMRILSALLK